MKEQLLSNPVGRPRLWHFFTESPWAQDYQYTYAGQIRDKHRHPIGDTHRLFEHHTRAEHLAREWFGEPPTSDCEYCGKRVRLPPRYRAPARTRAVGGGPRYTVVHLNGDHSDCARTNLTYAVDVDAEYLHAWQHAEACLRQPAVKVPAESLPRTALRPEPYDPAHRDAVYCWSSPFKIR